MFLSDRKEPRCPSGVPSVARAGPLHRGACWLQRSRAATLPWGSGQLHSLAWEPCASAAGQRLPGRVGFAVWFSSTLAALGREGGWGGAAATQQRGHFSPGPRPPWGISSSEQDGCQTHRIACQQQPRLRHHLFMDPLGFAVESIAAGYPLSKTYQLVITL